MDSKFSPGDKVFAKMRGYPPWPAKILGPVEVTPNKVKYRVFFYGTGDTGEVWPDDICSYVHNKDKHGKEKKRKKHLFALSIIEIENELSTEEKQILLGTYDFQMNIEPKVLNKKSHDSSKRIDMPGTSDSGSEINERKRNVPVLIFNNDGKKKRGRKPKKQIVKENNECRTIILQDQPPEGNNFILSGRFENFLIEMEYTADFITMLKDRIELPTDADFITAKVKNRKVDIPLTLNKPNFDKEICSLIWTVKVKIFALRLKERLEAGQLTPLSAEQLMEKWTAKQAKIDINLDILKVEAKLLEINLNIRTALNCDSDHDIPKTMKLLDQLLHLELTPLMIKKHVDVVPCVDKIRKYVGNIDLLESEEERKQMILSTEALREKAENVFSKFISYFHVPPSRTFWDIYKYNTKKLYFETRILNDEEFSILIDDPDDIIDN